MNCEAYIGYYRDNEISLYPKNLDLDAESGIVSMLYDGSNVGSNSFLAIKRDGEIVYYIFSVPLDNKPDDRIFAMIALNNVLITNIQGLNTFMKENLRSLSDILRIAIYDKNRRIYLHPEVRDNIRGLQKAQYNLKGNFNERFYEDGVQLASIDYGNKQETDVYTLLPDGRIRYNNTESTDTTNRGKVSIQHSVEAGNTVIIRNMDEDTARNTELEKILGTQEEKEKLSAPANNSTRQEVNTASNIKPTKATYSKDSVFDGFIAFLTTVILGLIGLALYFN